jgi:hypothetical protein
LRFIVVSYINALICGKCEPARLSSIIDRRQGDTAEVFEYSSGIGWARMMAAIIDLMQLKGMTFF